MDAFRPPPSRRGRGRRRVAVSTHVYALAHTSGDDFPPRKARLKDAVLVEREKLREACKA